MNRDINRICMVGTVERELQIVRQRTTRERMLTCFLMSNSAETMVVPVVVRGNARLVVHGTFYIPGRVWTATRIYLPHLTLSSQGFGNPQGQYRFYTRMLDHKDP